MNEFLFQAKMPIEHEKLKNKNSKITKNLRNLNIKNKKN